MSLCRSRAACSAGDRSMAIRRALGDPDYQVRGQAAEALAADPRQAQSVAAHARARYWLRARRLAAHPARTEAAAADLRGAGPAL